MGEARRRGNAPPTEKFKPGVVTLTDEKTCATIACWLDRSGKVYRLVKGARVMERELVEAAHDAARAAGMSDSTILRTGGLIIPAK